VQSDQGSYAFPFTLATGTVGGAVERLSADVPRSIPDDDPAGATSTLEVPTAGVLKDVDVRIKSITHTWVGDLKLELIAPDGTTVVLADRPGGSGNSGDDFDNTTFDDEASTTIAQASAPYTGSFRPQSDQLSRLDGHEQQGTWKLKVTDLAGADVGTIDGWGIDTKRAECSPTTATSPPEPPAGESPPTTAKKPPAANNESPAGGDDGVDLASEPELEFLERFGRVRADRRGRFRFAFLAAPRRAGRISFRTARAFGRPHRRRRLGTKRFTVPADGVVRVRVRLSRGTRRLLRRKRRLLVRAEVRVGDQHRGVLFTLQAPRRHRR
jgi:subtilisin-like proprotein convertase family protein